MAERVRAECTIEGNTWMDTHEVLPIAFGMKKLRMTCVLIDDMTCTDDIFEKIQETIGDEEIQNIDTVSLDKA